MKRLMYLWSFLLGVSSFAVSQLWLRMHFLRAVFGPGGPLAQWMKVSWLAVVILALTAGLFEESIRLLWRWLAYEKPGTPRWWRPKGSFGHAIAFGLGHGLCEATWLLRPLLALYPLSYLQLALFERALAIGLHVGLTVMIFYGVKRERAGQFFLGAVAIHTLVDGLALTLHDPVWTYGALIVVIVGLGIKVWQWKEQWV